MTNRLDPIILQKKREVATLKTQIRCQPESPISQILLEKTQRSSIKSLKNSLRCKSLAVIAEIKRKSPSKGHLANIDDPVALANTYIKSGANALSVLTDELFFGGSLNDLTNIATSVGELPNPILRKDFIIDEIQIAETIAAGADAILCIVAVLGEQTKAILNHAKKMNIEALVEVHDVNELEIALASGAEMIGINNRDLSTFEVDTKNAFTLLEMIPPHIVKVAESGILAPELAQAYYRAGFDAVLIGEALVKSDAPTNFIRACRHV